jgi:hypothetical protein
MGNPTSQLIVKTINSNQFSESLGLIMAFHKVLAPNGENEVAQWLNLSE